MIGCPWLPVGGQRVAQSVWVDPLVNAAFAAWRLSIIDTY